MRTTIDGWVESGQGGASKAMQGERLRKRQEASGMELIPGTLNIRVDDLAATVEALGSPDFETDQDNERLGPLRWWKVWLTTEGWWDTAAFVVRHERTGTDYLELVSDVHFRHDMSLRDGERVELRVGPSR